MGAGGADASGMGAAAPGVGAGAPGVGVGDASGAYSNTGSSSGEAPRRLYQIREGSVISGVCKGLAAYLNIDVSIIRILFVALVVLTGGVWILVYIVMMFVIPYAQTSEQHAAAHGWPFNAEELVTRAKAHYAQFRENGGKWQRKAYREQRRIWRSQHKQWKQHQRAWERWGGLGAPPPPPPPPPGWTAPPPPNPSYSAQLLHGVLSPIVGIVSVILLFTFIWTLIAMVKHHTFFGWWFPHDVPLWVGIVFLVVLYRAVAAPLNQARYAAYYGAPVGHAWIAFVGALVWLALVVFGGYLAWQHWDEILDFMQQVGNFFQGLIDRRATTPSDPWNAGLYFLGFGVPSCVLPGYVACRELESHGEIDGVDVLGETADGDVVDSGLGYGAYSLE
jgi:phage shock protein PspC (stress-responsive transcriptional regulator)